MGPFCLAFMGDFGIARGNHNYVHIPVDDVDLSTFLHIIIVRDT
jgi:hypothetical protein